MQPETKQEPANKQPQRQTITLDGKGPNQSVLPSIISETSHPIISLLHIATKIGVVFIYLTLPFVTTSFNMLAAVVLAAAVDFWIVKNLCGRYLVGLRWWIEFSEEGEQQFKFECKVDQKEVTWTNEQNFWWTLRIFGVVWVVFSVINVLKFDVTQICICLYCFTLLFFNHQYFYTCSKVQKENVAMLYRQMGKKAYDFINGSIISSVR